MALQSERAQPYQRAYPGESAEDPETQTARHQYRSARRRPFDCLDLLVIQISVTTQTKSGEDVPSRTSPSLNDGPIVGRGIMGISSLEDDNGSPVSTAEYTRTNSTGENSGHHSLPMMKVTVNVNHTTSPGLSALGLHLRISRNRPRSHRRRTMSDKPRRSCPRRLGTPALTLPRGRNEERGTSRR